MKRVADLAFLVLAACTLWATALWLWVKVAVDLPTRRPPVVIHLTGVTQMLFGAGPGLAGVTMALAAWRIYKGGEFGEEHVTKLETVFFLLGISSLIIAVLFGERIGV